MTRKQLAKLVEEWRKAILPEWRVILYDTAPEDMEVGDAWAVCRSPNDYLKLDIYFTDKLLKESLAEIEATVVHEMVHALTRPWRQLIERLEGDLPKAQHATLSEAQEHEEEQLVDRLAYALVAQAHNAEAFGTVERKGEGPKGKG